MSTQDFDNHIRTQLSGYETPLATDAMWAAVDAGMSRGHKFGFWWLWLSTALLLISFGGLAYQVVNHQVKVQSNMEVSHTLPSIETVHLQIAESDAEQQAHPFDSNKELLSKAEDIDSSVENDFDLRTAHALASNESQKSDNPSMGYTQGLKQQAEKDGSVAVFGATATKTHGHASQLPTPTVAEDYFQGSVKASAAAHNPGEPASVSSVADIASAKTRDASQTSFIPILAEAHPTAMPLINLSLTNAPMEPSLASLGSMTGFNPSYSSGYKDHMFIRIEAGAGLTDRKLQGQAMAYLAQREQTERPLEYLSAQLSAGWQFNNGVYLLSGISMTRINEHFAHTQHTIDIDQHSQLSNVHVNADGDSLFTYITTDVVSQTTTTYSHYNRYTLIDLPIALGYEWQWARWSVGLEAGALLNLNFRSSGSMLSPNDEVLRLEESNMFRQRINWSYTGQVRLAYALNEHWRIELAPGIRIIPGSVLLSNDMKQSYTLFGGQFGLRYAF